MSMARGAHDSYMAEVHSLPIQHARIVHAARFSLCPSGASQHNVVLGNRQLQFGALALHSVEC